MVDYLPQVDCSGKLDRKYYGVIIPRIGSKMAYQQFWLPTCKLNLIKLQKLRRLRAGEGGDGGCISSLGKRRVRVYTEMTDRQKKI